MSLDTAQQAQLQVVLGTLSALAPALPPKAAAAVTVAAALAAQVQAMIAAGATDVTDDQLAAIFAADDAAVLADAQLRAALAAGVAPGATGAA